MESNSVNPAIPQAAVVIDLTTESPPLEPSRNRINNVVPEPSRNRINKSPPYNAVLPPRKRARLSDDADVELSPLESAYELLKYKSTQTPQPKFANQYSDDRMTWESYSDKTTVLPPQPLPISTRKRGRPPRREIVTPHVAPHNKAVVSTARLPIAQQQKPFVTPLQDGTTYNIRCRARAEEWSRGVDLEDSDDDDTDDDNNTNQKWLSLSHRPYMSVADRRRILAGARHFVPPDNTIYHVDFTEPEIAQLQRQWQALMHCGISQGQALTMITLAKRKTKDIVAFVEDTKADSARLRDEGEDDDSIAPGQVLSLAVDRDDYRGSALRAAQITSLLLSREFVGARGGRALRGVCNFKTDFRTIREDDLELAECYDGGAGDIVTLSWITNDMYICGTTTHSDNENQQYNKPGNLMLGTPGAVRSIPDHCIPRPRVVLRENATEEQRRAAEDTYRSQSRWLYTSVVSTHYSPQLGLAFTASFDKTVKVWSMTDNMDLVGTWPHQGRVNFAAASKHPSRMVATAADVPTNAVRVYRLDDDNDLSASPYTVFSCSRVLDAHGNPMQTIGWAYFPATMQWGQSPGCEHLLLVGYSPRAFPGYKEDSIPEDKRNTGEICLWDCLTNTRVSITTASTQNVFEVVWNPVLPSFLVATSLSNSNLESKVNFGTHIRMFQPIFKPGPPLTLESFTEFRRLDCPARDINELVVLPNSGPKQLHCFVAAASTDGCVYVWDSAHGDLPMHVLRHGPTMVDLQGIDGSQGYDDNGVKFIAWGRTADRLYTGSSDGCVKVWNVRQAPGHAVDPLVRDLLHAKGAVSCGAFSPDYQKLAIGDASGQIHILTLDGRPSVDKQALKSCLVTLPGRAGKVRRPARVIPHPEIDDMSEEMGVYVARKYVQSGQITVLPRPIGAVQGPEYSSLGLYYPPAHLDGDVTKPLLAEFALGRRHLFTDALKSLEKGPRQWMRRLGPAPVCTSATAAMHAQNMRWPVEEFSLLGLDEEVRDQLRADGVDVDVEYELAEEAGYLI